MVHLAASHSVVLLAPLSFALSFQCDFLCFSSQLLCSNYVNRRCEFTKPQSPPRFSNNTSFCAMPQARNTHIFDLHYTNLMTDQDIVLADCVRRPGQAPVSRAFVRIASTLVCRLGGMVLFSCSRLFSSRIVMKGACWTSRHLAL